MRRRKFNSNSKGLDIDLQGDGLEGHEIVRDGVEFVDDILGESDRQEIGEGKDQQESGGHNKNLEPNRSASEEVS